MSQFLVLKHLAMIYLILGYSELTYDFDFFNYGGIDRPVLLYTLPKQLQIQDITVKTDLTSDLNVGTVQVSVSYFIEPDGINFYIYYLNFMNIPENKIHDFMCHRISSDSG